MLTLLSLLARFSPVPVVVVKVRGHYRIIDTTTASRMGYRIVH